MNLGEDLPDIYSAIRDALETVITENLELAKLRQFLCEEYGENPVKQTGHEETLGDFFEVVCSSNQVSDVDTRETSIDGGSRAVSPHTDYSESVYSEPGGVIITELPDVPHALPLCAGFGCQRSGIMEDCSDPLSQKYGISRLKAESNLVEPTWGSLLQLPRCIGLEDVVAMSYRLTTECRSEHTNRHEKKPLGKSIWKKVIGLRELTSN
jgi:hypothetical protein